MTQGKIVHVTVGRQGRLVIPAALRRSLGIEPGDDLAARLEGRSLILEPPDAALERAREHFREVPPGASLADELVADRRVEARLEDEKWKRIGSD